MGVAKESEKASSSLRERLEAFVEADAGPQGRLLGWASGETGQSKLNLYCGALGLAFLVLLGAGRASGNILAFLFSVPYPTLVTFRLMEVGSGVAQAEMLLYWVLHVLLSSVPVPAARFAVALWLQHPVTRGAALIYHGALRPALHLQHGTLHLPALARLQPAIAAALGLGGDVVAKADPAKLAKELGRLGQDVGLAVPILVRAAEVDAEPPLRPDSEANLLLHIPEYSNRLSVAVSALRNTAA